MSKFGGSVLKDARYSMNDIRVGARRNEFSRSHLAVCLWLRTIYNIPPSFTIITTVVIINVISHYDC